MRRFFIITNEYKDPSLKVTHAIRDYIETKGGFCEYFVSNEASWGGRELHGISWNQLAVECIIVLGGDGTLVRAARDLAHISVPLIGVNLGTLGYLCELDRDSIYGAIDLLFDDKYECEDRMMIIGSEENSENIDCSCALNDIVIHRIGISQIINLVVSVNGEYLTTYSADGLIISTPTGSTGYSMSAGGPIVDPKADLMLITPINPHSVSGRSIVVASDATIEIVLAKRRPQLDEMAEVCYDGDRFSQMSVGERITIHRADVNAKILKLNQLSFLQILRKKMQDYS